MESCEKQSEQVTEGAIAPPKKKLFQVDIELTIMVMAAHEQEARMIARQNIRHETNYADCIAYPIVSEMNRKMFPKEWIQSIPYDSDDDKTCGEILGIIPPQSPERNESAD